LLPILWFRNTWYSRRDTVRPSLSANGSAIVAHHAELGDYRFDCEGTPTLLFTDNETNNRRVFNTENASPFVKDAFHDYLIAGRGDAVNPARTGTKSAAHYKVSVPARGSAEVRLRLRRASETAPAFGKAFDTTMATRVTEADAFYASITPKSLSEDEARVM